MAESRDGKEIVIGEAKWANSVNISSACRDLENKIREVPGIVGKKIRKVLFLKYKPDFVPAGFYLFNPEQVIASLRK